MTDEDFPKLIDYNSLYSEYTQKLDPVKMQEFKRLAVEAWQNSNPVWEDWTPEEIIAACTKVSSNILVFQTWWRNRPRHIYKLSCEGKDIASIQHMWGVWIFSTEPSQPLDECPTFTTLDELTDLVKGQL